MAACRSDDESMTAPSQAPGPILTVGSPVREAANGRREAIDEAREDAEADGAESAPLDRAILVKVYSSPQTCRLGVGPLKDCKLVVRAAALRVPG